MGYHISAPFSQLLVHLPSNKQTFYSIFFNTFKKVNEYTIIDSFHCAEDICSAGLQLTHGYARR